MAKFVKLHFNGELILVNIDKVVSVEASDGGLAILYTGEEAFSVDETLTDVIAVIGAAQGGIPMEPGRMYDGA